MFQSLEYLLLFSALWRLSGALILLYHQSHSSASMAKLMLLWVGSLAAAVVLPLVMYRYDSAAPAVIAACFAIAFLTRKLLGNLSINGVFVLANRACVVVALTCAAFMAGPAFGLGAGAKVLILFVCIANIIGCVRTTMFGGTSSLVVEKPRLRRAEAVMDRGVPEKPPRVSIHVPCYSEPPAVVMETLEALSKLEYDNYEVIVVDNNTEDPQLWMPVRDFCAKLGDKFRFFHVSPLSGAKAGALNFALTHCGDDIDLIAVVDADYIAEPHFLIRFVPLFSDPQTGFVQTSHDYREWENSRFLTGAYYEYTPFHKLSLPSINEFSASFTVGTMCLIRREALERAGRWCEKCLTEDSEIAIRIHAAGYVGHTFEDTVGRGFIPETMSGMKKQQFRWTAGPVQQIMMHWRLYLGVARHGRLTLAQRLLEIHHSISRVPSVIMFSIATFLLPLILAVAVNGYSVELPQSLIILFMVTMIKNAIENAIVVRLAGGKRIRDQIYCTLVRSALEWTYICGVLAPLLGRRMHWSRTSKFKKVSSFKRALVNSRTETLLALTHLAAAAILVPYASVQPLNLITLIVFGLLQRSLVFGATLPVALLAERDLPASQAGASFDAILGRTMRKPGHV